MDGLNKYTTKDLVEELMTREGVETKIVDPYVTETIIAEGPAIVFIVID